MSNEEENDEKPFQFPKGFSMKKMLFDAAGPGQMREIMPPTELPKREYLIPGTTKVSATASKVVIADQWLKGTYRIMVAIDVNATSLTEAYGKVVEAISPSGLGYETLDEAYGPGGAQLPEEAVQQAAEAYWSKQRG